MTWIREAETHIFLDQHENKYACVCTSMRRTRVQTLVCEVKHNNVSLDSLDLYIYI